METWEKAFVKSHVETLSSLPIVYGDNYEQPPSNWPKRVAMLPVELPKYPERRVESTSFSSATMTLVFKSVKPPASFTLSLASTDTIASIKESLGSQRGAPPPSVQRLLLKGKALADAKLLKEYPVSDGDTINLMTKPGYTWEPSTDPSDQIKSALANVSKTTNSLAIPVPMEGVESTSSRSRSHSRTGSVNIPDLVLSPTPHSASTPTSSGKNPTPITLTLDTSVTSSQPSTGINTYHTTLSNPNFWERLYMFLKHEFGSREDAASAFEDFLLASKGHMTPGEIAKIRDSVGVLGMAGT